MSKTVCKDKSKKDKGDKFTCEKCGNNSDKKKHLCKAKKN